MQSYLVILLASLIAITAILAILVVSSKKRHSASRGSAKKLASSLTNEKAKSDIILNSIEDGVMLIDNAEHIQLFNPAASRITGWDPKEAAGIIYKSVLQLIDEKGEPYQPHEDPVAQAMQQKMTVSDRKAVLKTRGNKNIALDITVSPLMGENDSVLGSVCIFRDVSEQRLEEEQRAEFISTASHEMRTPVAAIEGYLALAMNDKVSRIDDKARGFLEKAHDSTKHLGKLFQDLLTSAKAEDGRLTNHPVVVEMGQFLSDLCDAYRFSAEKKGLGMEFVLGAPDAIIDASDTSVVKPLYYVHVDPDRLREVITNLFDNAVKYTDEGKVSIGLTGDTSVVQIRIADTGHGIPPEDVSHLFQKFYRVDNSATRTIGGTGLGLFISKKIIELYNGRIWVDSEVGKGSTFYINLPRLSTDQASAMQRHEASQLPMITTADTKL